MLKTAEKFVFVYPVGNEGEASKINFLNEVKRVNPAFEEKYITCLPCDGKEKTIINNLSQISNLNTESNLLHLILSNEIAPLPYGGYMENFYSLVPDKFHEAAFLYAYEYEQLKGFEIKRYIKPNVNEYYDSLEEMVCALFVH